VAAGPALQVVADEVAGVEDEVGAADEAVAAAVDVAERSIHVDIIKRTGGT
jgi:hypothetical protein